MGGAELRPVLGTRCNLGIGLANSFPTVASQAEGSTARFDRLDMAWWTESADLSNLSRTIGVLTEMVFLQTTTELFQNLQLARR